MTYSSNGHGEYDYDETEVHEVVADDLFVITDEETGEDVFEDAEDVRRDLDLDDDDENSN